MAQPNQSSASDGASPLARDSWSVGWAPMSVPTGSRSDHDRTRHGPPARDPVLRSSVPSPDEASRACRTGSPSGASSPPPLSSARSLARGSRRRCRSHRRTVKVAHPTATAYSADAGRPGRIHRCVARGDRDARTGHRADHPLDAVGRPPRGVATAFGVAAGQAVWALATSVGLAALIVASEPVFLTIRIVGAAYLLWLGGCAIRAAIRGEDAHPPPTAAHERAAERGAPGPAQQPLEPQDGHLLHEPVAAVRDRWRVRDAARARRSCSAS